MITHSGQIGIVLLPDEETHNRSVAYADATRPNTLDIGGAHMPHLTLYHARLVDVPHRDVEELLCTIAHALPLRVPALRIAPYAMKYLFFDVERNERLVKMHEQALSLARYFPKGQGAVGTGTLDLSPRERENIETYGHPLVRELWRPHITIGYCETGFSALPQTPHGIACFAHVALVEVGEYGTAKRVIVKQ